jgi:glycosyltransferase involved in cell wall biosynthesis
MTGLVSVIIPSADPRFLPKMIPDLLAKAAGPIEIIVSLDGVDAQLPDDPRVIAIRHPRLGMRGALNAARARVSGEWVMKTDEHCLFAEGFDETLKADCTDNWLLIPRRYSLDAERWAIEDNPKGPRDYHYLSCPVWSIREKDDYSMHGLEWPERTRERLNKPEYDIDETLSWQGSCYFMSRRHYEWLGPLVEENWGTFAGEPQEIGLKTQLFGGRIMVTKKTWYAHLHKGKKYGRGYRPDGAEISRGHEYNAWYWVTNQWPERKRSLRWLVERFWPVPTWPIDAVDRWAWYFPPGATLDELKARAFEREQDHA